MTSSIPGPIAKAWPVLYHVTPQSNLPRLRAVQRLDSPAVLLKGTTYEHMLSSRRMADVVTHLNEFEVIVRNQIPLNPSYLEFVDGWSFADYLVELNSRVFFWPGDWSGPNGYGQRHLASRFNVSSVLLRTKLKEILAGNPGTVLFLSRFNTGAPRLYYGRRSPRGPDTFIPAVDWPHTPSRVAEASFVGSVKLPASIEVYDLTARSWKRVFGDA